MTLVLCYMYHIAWNHHECYDIIIRFYEPVIHYSLKHVLCWKERT